MISHLIDTIIQYPIIFPLKGAYSNTVMEMKEITDCIKGDKGELHLFLRIINKFPLMSEITVSVWPFSSHFSKLSCKYLIGQQALT